MLYVAYGSNLHPTRLRKRAPSAVLLGNATVPGMALRFHKRSKDGSAKCNVVWAQDEIHVAVYDMEKEEKSALDAAEGLGTGYRIENLDVGNYGTCFMYVATERYIDETLMPFCWYKELVLAGCDYFRFPRRYIDRISAVESLEDPDHERQARQMRIVHEARNSPG